MPSESTTLLLITLLIFGCSALLVFSLMRTVAYRERIRRRYGTMSAPVGGQPELEEEGPSWLDLDPIRLGLDPAAQRKLRAELIRAGFFAPGAVVAFTLFRFALLVLMPLIGFAAITLGFQRWEIAEAAVLTLTLLIIAYVLPGAYLSRRQRLLEAKYRLVFPDFLDMLVVCINAGLSLEAGLDRAGREIGRTDPEIKANLFLMAGEMRAGKSTGDALKALADRLALREARSFAGLLQQTIELGTDVAQALATFSDEMRDKRMSRAEEKAAALPPKLTLPLGLFIFPVVLIAVLAPAALRIMSVIGR